MFLNAQKIYQDTDRTFLLLKYSFTVTGRLYSPKVLVIPRNRWLRLNMTEKLFTGTLNHNKNKTKTVTGESHHEQTFLEMRKKAHINCTVTTQLISALVFTTWIVQFLFFQNLFEISSLQSSSLAVQPGLCNTLSETPNTGFLMIWPRY